MGMTKRNAIVISVLTIFAIPVLYYSYQAVFSGTEQTQVAAQKVIYICPMHPEITQDHPGTCPICGMKLVESKEGAVHEHGILVDSASTQRLGVRLAKVVQASIGQDIQAYGNIVADERALYNVQPRYDGWIRKLHVHSVGEQVREGQVIYEIYSPELINRERTFISNIDKRKQLLQTIPTTADTENEYVMELTMDAAKDRSDLHVIEGLSVETIQQMEGTRQTVDVAKIVSAHTGVVSQLNIREGAYASASTTLFTLANVSRAWVDVLLYPDQVAQARVGDPVLIQVADGEPIHAKLDFISPLAENNKVHARVYLDNAPYKLKPGSYADVTIMAHAHAARVLPRSAIIYTAQGNRVMLARGDGHFLPVPVRTGVESGDLIEIVSGLREGAEVAVNGQFLLDASASMQAAGERMHAH